MYWAPNSAEYRGRADGVRLSDQSGTPHSSALGIREYLFGANTVLAYGLSARYL